MTLRIHSMGWLSMGSAVGVVGFVGVGEGSEGKWWCYGLWPTRHLTRAVGWPCRSLPVLYWPVDHGAVPAQVSNKRCIWWRTREQSPHEQVRKRASTSPHNRTGPTSAIRWIVYTMYVCIVCIHVNKLNSCDSSRPKFVAIIRSSVAITHAKRFAIWLRIDSEIQTAYYRLGYMTSLHVSVGNLDG